MATSAIAERFGSTNPRRIPVVPVLACALFAVLACAVKSGGPVVALDHRINDWLTVHRTPGGLRLALAAINLGEPTRAPLALLTLAVVCSARRHSWEPIRFAATAVAALSVVVLVAKNSFGRVGPAGQVGVGLHNRFGAAQAFLHRGAFPSGHTTTAIVTWTIAVILVRGRLGRAGIVLVAAVGLVVGAALIYAGFHWFSDVLGAYAVGTALSWALLRIPRPVPARANRTDSHVSDFLGRAPVTTRSRAGA